MENAFREPMTPTNVQLNMRARLRPHLENKEDYNWLDYIILG